jgi:heparosan-N-sulfate-glucuronate 5-epimerase
VKQFPVEGRKQDDLPNHPLRPLAVLIGVLFSPPCAGALEAIADRQPLGQFPTHYSTSIAASAIVLTAVLLCVAYLVYSWDFDYDRHRVIINDFEPFARRLGDYYVAFPHHRHPSHTDANGIPLLYFGPLNGLVHYTIYIAQCGLECYSSLVADGHRAAAHKCFLSYAEWILASLTRSPAGFGVWRESSFRFGHRIRPPWTSAMAQGEGISVLLRAYELSQERRFLDGASMAFRAFVIPVHDGGLRTTIDAGMLFFDEYPATPPTRVLNGFITALWGIWDFYRVTSDQTAREIFFEGIQTLREILPRYDRDGWSRYALYEGGGIFHKVDCPASVHYHLTHVAQLRVLHKITDEPLFLQLADRWDRSKERFMTKVRMWVLYRVVFRVQRVGTKAALAWDVIRESS